MKGAVRLIRVERVARLAARYGDRFLARAFTPAELGECLGRHDTAERLAARLAAKQAARQVLGGRGLPLSAFTLSRDPGGAPRLDAPGVPPASLHVSLSHDGGLAAAAVFLDSSAVRSGSVA